MSAKTQKVLRTLAGLNENDRRWIVDRLPPQTREALWSGLNPEAEGAAQARARNEKEEILPLEDAEAEEPLGDETRPVRALRTLIAQLNAVPATRIVPVLRTEEAWIIHAILGAHRWRWRGKLLKSLFPHRRLDVRQLERSGAVLATLPQRWLLEALWEQVQEPPADERFGPLLKGFMRKAAV